MSDDLIDRTFGRQGFGTDPGRYHAARPAYPDWVFEVLCEQCGLAGGTATFEIGAGTGTATRRLLDRGASPLVAVEPDPRMATYLRETIPDEALRVILSSFEEAVLDAGSFDLGISATAFHWLDETTALIKIAELLRPGGWWAMVWNVFGDDSRPDPFHEATKALLNGPSSPSAGARNIPFADPIAPDCALLPLRQQRLFRGTRQLARNKRRLQVRMPVICLRPASAFQRGAALGAPKRQPQS
jgi:SAM-dependent methyltransferase